jgi:hypothetical protein
MDTLVQALLRMPGFNGVRQQVLALFRQGLEAWSRTHAKSDVYPWPERAAYLDKSIARFHVPDPMRLDVMARWLS